MKLLTLFINPRKRIRAYNLSPIACALTHQPLSIGIEDYEHRVKNNHFVLPTNATTLHLFGQEQKIILN